jgi:hypothetical protein
MVAINPNGRISFDGNRPIRAGNRLAERVHYDFQLHAVLVREKFLLTSVRREIEFRELTPAPLMGDRDNWVSAARPRPSAKDIRLHVWLAERLAVLHHERHGLWPKLRRSVKRLWRLLLRSR